MTLEITRPETEARIQRYLRSGQFHDLDELLTKALDTNIISEYNRDKRPNPGVVKWIERSSNGLRTICRSGLPDEFSLSTTFVTRKVRHFAGLDLPILNPWDPQ